MTFAAAKPRTEEPLGLSVPPSAIRRMVSGDLQVAFGAFSSAGAKSRNDDAFAAELPRSQTDRTLKGAVACIADGVSESSQSHLASQLSVTQFINDYFATPASWSVETSASRVLRALNDWLSVQGRQTRQDAMVTTFSAAIVKSNTAHVFHVGDSRIYLLNDDGLTLLTRDHNIVVGPGNRMLSAALGMDPRLNVDYSQVELAVGDALFFATDGVADVLSQKELTDTLRQGLAEGDKLAELAEQICERSIVLGSQDNVTCGIARIDSLAVESAEEAHARVQAQKIPPVLSVGQKIDGLEVRKLLYSGTRSHLYKVKDGADGQTYVLKAPSRNFTEDPVYLEGFIREQWVGQRLDHPGLMKVHPRRNDSQFLYILCEHIEGQTLRDWIADNPNPPLSRVRALADDVIAALRTMHRMGMVHRDLKPENIMLTHDGDVKLIDFGTVQVAGIDDLTTAISEQHAVGSVDYSAPEHVIGHVASTRSDLFSLGVIIYEMLTGQRPYSISSAQRRSPKIAYWSHVAASTVRGDIPDWVSAALEKACSADPASRYPVLSELAADLKSPGSYARRKQQQVAFIDRNPIAFWKGLSLALFLITLCLSALLLQASPA